MCLLSCPLLCRTSLLPSIYCSQNRPKFRSRSGQVAALSGEWSTQNDGGSVSCPVLYTFPSAEVRRLWFIGVWERDGDKEMHCPREIVLCILSERQGELSK